MVCLGLKPGAAEWKAQTNPLSYGGTPKKYYFLPPWLRKIAEKQMYYSEIDDTGYFHKAVSWL